jgi:hypothetical protein
MSPWLKHLIQSRLGVYKAFQLQKDSYSSTTPGLPLVLVDVIRAALSFHPKRLHVLGGIWKDVGVEH